MLISARRTLIAGASRPLGLEAVKQCLERGDRVIATCRNPARVPLLADLRARYGTLELVALDPADAASVAEVVPVLESITTSIDLLIISPGDAGPHERTGEKHEQRLDELSATELVEHFRRHAVAPLLLVRTLMPMLREAERARVVFVPSGRVSQGAGLAYAEDASRAALETLVRVLAHDVAEHGVTVTFGPIVSDGNVTSHKAADVARAELIRDLLAQNDEVAAD
ncbi:MAG: SDR family NAD(P)-dependent oxidoreductase [Phycisphaerae bacterium]|nr:SDR family NAD(P)-dependent oxidoreductase [Gemmatimonadaceae bacterium]